MTRITPPWHTRNLSTETVCFHCDNHGHVLVDPKTAIVTIDVDDDPVQVKGRKATPYTVLWHWPGESADGTVNNRARKFTTESGARLFAEDLASMAGPAYGPSPCPMCEKGRALDFAKDGGRYWLDGRMELGRVTWQNGLSVIHGAKCRFVRRAGDKWPCGMPARIGEETGTFCNFHTIAEHRASDYKPTRPPAFAVVLGRVPDVDMDEVAAIEGDRKRFVKGRREALTLQEADMAEAWGPEVAS